MPRTARVQPGGYVFHVLNRGNAQMALFEKEADYAAFEKAMTESAARVGMRLLAYCLMPNHWHLVLRPHGDGDLGRYMHGLTTTHVRRWHAHRHSVGYGHLYQGAYKSFPIQADKHFLTVCRYVERNALRAGMVEKAEDWRWGSMGRRYQPDGDEDRPVLSPWPVDRLRHWRRLVNTPQSAKDLEAVRLSVRRGRPLGGEAWQARTAKRLQLESTLRNRGRPRKK
ncbi:MAG: transposase [Planctomycetota bacterium]